METETSGRPDRSVLATCSTGLRHLRRAWPRFIAADLATRVAATLLLTPIVAFVARRALNRAGSGAVTDQDIVWFVLTPLGIATMLFVVAGSSLAGLMGHTAIMTIAAGMHEDRAVSQLAGLRHAINRLTGVKVKQPQTPEERLDQASDSHDRLNLVMPMVVDDMDNEIWRLYGAASSPAFVIDQRGVIVTRQVWLDPEEIRRILDQLLGRAGP